MEYRFTDGADEDFAYLCEVLDRNSDELVADKFEQKYNTISIINVMIFTMLLLSMKKVNWVGCASYKKFDLETAEIKRVFVI